MLNKEEILSILHPKDVGKIDNYLDYYNVKHSICMEFQPKRIGEIGVRAGYSAWAFLKACPDAEYIGFDNYQGAHGGGGLEFKEHAHKILKEYKHQIVVVNTQAIINNPNFKVDFFHVDGDHSLAGCYKDMNFAWKCLDDNGIILVDDYDYLKDVRGAVDEWLLEHDTEVESTYRPSYRGEMIIRKLPGIKGLDIGPGDMPVIGFDTMDINGDPTINADFFKPLPIDDSAYDIVYASNCLEHAPWYMTLDILKEWHRIVKPGGKLEVWVPDLEKYIYIYMHNKLEKDDRKPLIHGDVNPKNDKTIWFNNRIFGGGYDARYSKLAVKYDKALGPESWHRAMFDERYLIDLFEQAGFKDIIKLFRPRAYHHGWTNLGIQGTK